MIRKLFKFKFVEVNGFSKKKLKHTFLNFLKSEICIEAGEQIKVALGLNFLASLKFFIKLYSLSFVSIFELDRLRIFILVFFNFLKEFICLNTILPEPTNKVLNG